MTDTINNYFSSDFDSGVLKAWFAGCMSEVANFIICVLLALIIYAIGIKILKGIRKLVTKRLKAHDVDKGVIQFVDKTLLVAGIIAIIVIVLGLFGITTSSIAAAIASLGITAGFAFQGSLSNFAGGILILVLKPFKVGDYIREDTKNNEGTVKEISIFYTKLITADGKLVVVPNGTLANSSMTNLTHCEKRMINAKFGISYEDDIKMAKNILENLAMNIPTRIEGEDVKVFVFELGDSSVDIGVRVYIETETFWDNYWKFIEDVKYAFDEHGISIPYDQLDVHMTK